MWFDEASEFAEFFRGTIPYYLIIILPIFIIISPVNPVSGAHEFSVYRMQQYDLHGSPYGCRNALVNVEARSLDSQVYTRRCVVARLKDLSPGKFLDILTQLAGGLLILLPPNLAVVDERQVRTEQSNISSEEEKRQVLELEQAMLYEDVSVPVYFAVESPELTRVLQDIQLSSNSDHAASAAEALLGSISASGYQMVLGGSQAKVQTDVHIANIQGKLSGYGVEEQLPTVAIVAYYDSFGVAPELSYGADSNGSGVAMLLELARLFSRLYTNSRTHARFNLLFLLSGGGKFNYQGSKKWLEDQLDGLEASLLLQDSMFTLCLDTVGAGDELYLHVSKPPKERSAGALFVEKMKSVADTLYPSLTVDTVHKKINLADDMLAWEHERFSIRRLPAFTLSRLKTPKSSERTTILDTREKVNSSRLARNTKVVAEALARQIYKLPNQGEVFMDGMAVEKEALAAWVDYLSSQPRSTQLLASKHNHVVNTLEQAMARYLKEVKVTYMKPDKRDPEFMFYDMSKATMNAYSVKPAVFDLFLTIAIVAYLALVYLFIQNFTALYVMMTRVLYPLKAKAQ